MKNTDNNSQKPSWMTITALILLIIIVTLLPFMSRSKQHKPADPVFEPVAEEVTSLPQEQPVSQSLAETQNVITNNPVIAEASNASVVITGQTGTFGFEPAQKSHSQMSSILPEEQLRELVDAQKSRVMGRK